MPSQQTNGLPTPEPERSAPMADAFTGHNSDKIDQLIGAVGSLRVEVSDLKGEIKVFKVVNSIVAAVALLGIPYLVTQVNRQGEQIASLTAEMRNLTANVQLVTADLKETGRELRDQRDRITKIEAAQKKP